MNESLLKKLNGLKYELDNDPRVIKLNELDKKMNASSEVAKLSYGKEMMLLDFEDALNHFGEKSKEVQEAQKRLYEAKLSLDNHPLCKEYMTAYLEVKKLYKKVNDSLFKPFFDEKYLGDEND